MKPFHKQLKDRLEATGDFSQPMWHFMADVLEHTANEADRWTNRSDDARRIPDMIDEACRFCREEAKNHEVADPVVVRLEAEVEELKRQREKQLEITYQYREQRDKAYGCVRNAIPGDYSTDSIDSDMGRMFQETVQKEVKRSKRLEREVEELKAQLDYAGDGDTWREACKRLEEELEATREQLRQQTKSFCTHCGKLFPKGKEGVEQFREHIAECNAHPLNKMAVDNEHLRCLLREALEAWHSAAYRFAFLNWRGDIEWGKKAQAALEAKP